MFENVVKLVIVTFKDMVYWMAYANYHILPGLKVCDAIKQNEPEFANIDFEI